ncbi:MAG: YdcF family protein, partial [Desulfobacteraceae bacterium]|nr:YdcF family protein [Desulfobacteraceae bacterium]
ENKYPPLDPARARGIEYIVVLGSGHISDKRLPVTSQIDKAALARLTEAIRLQRLLPGSKLLLSGGAVSDPVPEAEVMAGTARALGVPANAISLEDRSRDTEEEAHLIKGMVGGRPFVLVTSAAHLPRSMALFEHLGMKPLPAPADHGIKENGLTRPLDYFPEPGNIAKSEAAIHEYLGMAWAKLRGSI